MIASHKGTPEAFEVATLFSNDSPLNQSVARFRVYSTSLRTAQREREREGKNPPYNKPGFDKSWPRAFQPVMRNIRGTPLRERERFFFLPLSFFYSCGKKRIRKENYFRHVIERHRFKELDRPTRYCLIFIFVYTRYCALD